MCISGPSPARLPRFLAPACGVSGSRHLWLPQTGQEFLPQIKVAAYNSTAAYHMHTCAYIRSCSMRYCVTPMGATAISAAAAVSAGAGAHAGSSGAAGMGARASAPGCPASQREAQYKCWLRHF